MHIGKINHISQPRHSWPHSPWIHKSETRGRINGRMCRANQKHWSFWNITVTLRKYSSHCKVQTYKSGVNTKASTLLALGPRMARNAQRNKKPLQWLAATRCDAVTGEKLGSCIKLRNQLAAECAELFGVLWPAKFNSDQTPLTAAAGSGFTQK